MVHENSGPINAWIFGLSTVVYGDTKLSKTDKIKFVFIIPYVLKDFILEIIVSLFL